MSFDIEPIKNKMLVKYPFFGSVVANVDYKESVQIQTAGTDGQTIYYNPEFFKKLDSNEQTFVLTHEVCHIAFDHIRRSEGKDPEVWNTATDGVINQFLKRDGLKMVEGSVDIPEAINYDAEQLYDKLLKEKQQNQGHNGQSNEQNKQDTSSSKQTNQEQGQSSSNGSQNQNENQAQGQDSTQDEEQSQEQSNSQGNQQDTSSSKQANQGQEQSSSNGSQNQNENQTQGQDFAQDEEQSLEQSNSQGNQQDTPYSKQTNQDQGQSSSNGSQNQNENQEQVQSSTQDEEQNHDVGHDTHSMWKDAVKRQKEEKTKDKKESKSDEKQKQQAEKLKEAIEKISKMGEQGAFHKNLEEKRKELEQLKQLLSKQVMKAGNSTNSEQRIINDIGKSTPIIDWRYILREAIQYDVDWSYKNAEIEDGIVSAKLEEQPMPETEIVLDTSGSINELLLKNFLRECKNILQYSKVKAGCFDTEFYGFHEIRTEEDIENMEFQGSGGTDFNVAVRAFTRRVENKIIFTDGEADMPNIPMDVIWIVFGNKTINPKGGKVIQINDEQLDRLYSFEQDISYKGTSR